jgi:hypothetical protein
VLIICGINRTFGWNNSSRVRGSALCWERRFVHSAAELRFSPALCTGANYSVNYLRKSEIERPSQIAMIICPDCPRISGERRTIPRDWRSACNANKRRFEIRWEARSGRVSGDLQIAVSSSQCISYARFFRARIFFLRPIALQFLRVFAGIRQDCNLVGSSAGQAVKSKKKPPACPLWLCGNNCPGRQLRSAFMPDNYKSYLIAFLASISSRFLSEPQSPQLSSVTVLITF